MHCTKNYNKGFTLLELLVVVLILGILALVSVPAMLSSLKRAKESAVKANYSALSTTVVGNMSINGQDPATAATNAVNTLNDPDGSGSIDATSPFNPSLPAFVDGAAAGSGQVTAVSSATQVDVAAHGKDGEVLASRVLRDASSS